MGRHRKPSTSSVSVAKLAVTGVVIGGSGLGMAAGAQAASDTEWDTVARCESSGNWAINTGNGYQGGLQFSPSTWLGYGGGQFASAANLASRDQQIAIAEKVLAGQGRGAWPVCGRGLSGPTPRSVSNQTAPKPAAPAAAADAPQAPAPAAPDAPNVDSTVVEVQNISVGEDPNAKADAAPLVAADTIVEVSATPAAVEDTIVEVSATPVAVDDQIVAVGGELADSGDAPIVPVAHPAPAAQAAPAAVPAAPAPAAAAPATTAPATTATGAGTTTVGASTAAPASTATVAVGQTGIPHLPSPHNPPPGTSDEPVGPAGNANVSYLKELWHAVQNQEIDRNDLMLALASRSLNTPVQSDAGPAPVAADAVIVDVPADN